MYIKNLFWGAISCLLLSGCELAITQPSPVVKEAPLSNFLAVEQSHECDFSPDVADLVFACEEESGGTVPVLHPIEDFDYTFAQKQKNEDWVSSQDLWQQVRRQLTFPIPNNRRVQNQLRWYKQHPNYMQRVNKRAAPFLYHIVKEVENSGLPLELVLLPIVESAFDPFAYSHGRAAGMWQFIPGTAKRFGMKQNWWYDGRRDVLASTRGAIKYLKYLHRTFDGDWLHALAAYNSGEGRVLKAIKKNRARGKATDFWSLDLPRETRAYVPKLLALSELLFNNEDYNFPWPRLQNQPFTEIVDVGSQIDLALAAEMAGLSVEELHALNPGFNRWATDPKGPHYLFVPISNAPQFRVALDETSNKERLNWVRHKVRNGDSLLKIAKRYHTSVDVIQQINKVKGNMIRVGDHLLVPVALKSLDYYTLSQEERLKTTQSTKHGAHQLAYVVKQGDTLWDISRAHNVNLRKLAKWNGMAPTDPLKPGRKLIVWVSQLTQEQTSQSIMRSVTYTVRNGDSLARIASKFKVRINDITRWNNLNKKKYLQPGQKIKLFVDVTKT
ncbi:lytic transglycosylase [Alteromonas sp. a30]|uniref:lytic transglycosylase n=1 Tax=Alteromonas sp. a30 TaxID=2730917 RepID=UPI00228031D6|nr:LysM peptidoglycan-binding domain-containing protein [Alteromonas sp. a30]MCY7297009.1 LysM peptidoglycan-binding domain-containing protein [Alteromonas sp. a30]